MTAVELPAPVKVDGPGVYDLPEAEYHARPELSSTGVRKLIRPSCPAKFKHWVENGDPPKQEWDEGSGAHKLVLGEGPKLARIEGDGKSGPEVWNTNAVKLKVQEARDRGEIPLKPSSYAMVHEMAEALKADAVAAPFFAPGTGRAEMTLIWDERAGWWDADGGGHVTTVRCRALVDWLPNRPTARGRMVLPDYKSCASASLEATEKDIGRWGYYIQLRFYERALIALGLADETVEGVLVFQERTAPYLVTVRQPDREAKQLADRRITEALALYAEATATGRWRGYADDVVMASLPPWETKELREDTW